MPNRPDDLVVSVEPRMDAGASPLATGPSQVEPVPVSPLRASVPSAERELMYSTHWLSHEIFRLARQMSVTSHDSIKTGKPVRARAVKAMERDAREVRAACDQILGIAAQIAQAIEARRAATGTGAVHESAVVEDHAPETDRNPHQEDTQHDTD